MHDACRMQAETEWADGAACLARKAWSGEDQELRHRGWVHRIFVQERVHDRVA